MLIHSLDWGFLWNLLTWLRRKDPTLLNLTSQEQIVLTLTQWPAIILCLVSPSFKSVWIIPCLRVGMNLFSYCLEKEREKKKPQVWLTLCRLSSECMNGTFCKSMLVLLYLYLGMLIWVKYSIVYHFHPCIHGQLQIPARPTSVWMSPGGILTTMSTTQLVCPCVTGM